MKHEKQYKQTLKNILIFPHHRFPFCVFIFVYFEHKKKLFPKSKIKKEEEKTCTCFDPLHVVDVAAVPKKNDTNVLLYCCVLYFILI